MSSVSLPVSDSESLQKKRPDMRAAVPAALITLLILGATLIVVFWVSDPASAESTAVYAGAEGGRLLLSFERVELSGEEGSAGWGSLEPVRGERDTRSGPTRIAAGDPGEGPFAKARIVFDRVMTQRGEGLDSLHVPERVVEIHVDDSGGPGDGLLIVFDAEKSVQDEEGVLSFRPAIIHAGWVDGAAAEDKTVEVPQRLMPPLFSSARFPGFLVARPVPGGSSGSR